jgi:hypothetical protein
MARSTRTPRRRAGGVFAAACASVVLAGCPVVRSVVNADPDLRWWAFKTYGVGRICPEMLKASVALKMQTSTPTIGRYVPTTCATQINDATRTVLVRVSGTGFAYVAPAKRVGFSLGLQAEYGFDFRLHEDGAWLWGRLTRLTAPPDFRVTWAENPLVDLATIATPAGGMANLFGGQVVSSFLARGFTVIETEQSKDFSLGTLPTGSYPYRPVNVDDDDDALLFANEVSDIPANQRDFIGPFEVADADQSVILRGSVSGSSLDLLFLPKAAADAWRAGYQAGVDGPLPAPPFGAMVLRSGPFQTRVKLPPGLWVGVVDNTRTLGQAAPTGLLIPNPMFDPVTQFTYAAQLVED